MSKKLILITLLGCTCIIPGNLAAQQNFWTRVTKNFDSELPTTIKSLPTSDYVQSILDVTAFRSMLQSVPKEGVNGDFVAGKSFSIPLPGGNALNTSILESPIWDAGSVGANIKTYVLVNTSTKSLEGRITVTPEGISGILFTGEGVFYINPLSKDETTVHVIYKTTNVKAEGAVCISNENQPASVNNRSTNANRTTGGDCKPKTYRLAVAATGEYTNWAGSQANALTYITITINNVMAVFDRDLGVRFNLVTNNSILFTDGATDPYPDPNLTNWQLPASNANQTALDTYFGNNAYDVGIVFSKGWGAGYAPTGAVCKPADKGKSAAGISNGQGLNPVAGPQGFVFDYTVIHELGHMFGAAHTFASNAGFCAPYGNFATAYEPGAGSSIMSYAPFASCGSYVSYNEPYFHAGSIAQMQAYLATTSCGVEAISSNNPPIVTVASASYNLPVSTPFTLSGNGVDPDGNTLLYNWEQMDAAFTATPPPGTNTTGSNFRTYPPTVIGNVRTFPRMEDIAAGIATPYEKLTSVSRAMNFRLTARDQSFAGGCTGSANVTLNFNNSAGPFMVTSQTSPITWVANGANTQTITWNVASTNLAPVNCTAVNILLSVDGGITYPYTIAGNTANDGSEVVTVPNIPTQSGRIKIQPVNNIFFNINSANITITGTCAAEGTTFIPSAEVWEPAGSPALNLSLTPQYGTTFTPTGSITIGNPSTLLPIYNDAIPSCANYGFTEIFKYVAHPFVVATPGTYTFNIPTPFGLVYNIYKDEFDPNFPCLNFMASNTITGITPTTIRPTVFAALSPGIRYVLVVGSYNSANFPFPQNYTVSVSGGSIYTNPVSPGASFNYVYVVVDNNSGIIKSISATANLSNSVTYPGGTSYTVHGLSYSNSSPVLAGFVGGNFSALTDALYYNNAYCGNLSKNALKVNAVITYTFTGSGNWSDAANWANNAKPPSPISGSAEIIISGSGECILDVPVIFTPNVKLTISPGKTLRVL